MEKIIDYPGCNAVPDYATMYLMYYAKHLREARTALIPQVPQLAPQLSDNPDAVKAALCDHLAEKGLDIEAIRPLDLNKAERHLYSGFSAFALREAAVEGLGRDATLKDFTLINKPLLGLGLHPTSHFLRSIRPYQKQMLPGIVERYTHGDDPQHQWWPLAQQRCQRLGGLAWRQAKGKVPIEGIFLNAAVKTRGLMSGARLLFNMVNVRLDAPPPERVEAAHDLIHIPLSTAALHVEHLLRLHGRTLPKADIKRDDSGVYRIHYAEEDRAWMKLPPSHNKSFATVTMKCPAHSTGGMPAENAAPGDTNLRTIMHAIINTGYEHGAFGGLVPAWNFAALSAIQAAADPKTRS